LPLTSPSSSASAPPRSRQTPKKSPPPTSCSLGSYTSPTSQPDSAAGGSGTKPRVSAAASRRSRWKSSALAIAPAAPRASPCSRRSSSAPKCAGASWAALNTPNRRPPSASGTCTKEPICSVSITRRMNRSRSSSRLTYGSPVCAARPSIPSPSRTRVPETASLNPLPATARSSSVVGSKRRRSTLVAPVSAWAWATIAR
jgi:hypothetical protein